MDRFDEMAERVLLDLACAQTGRRRLVADALRAAHASGVDEAAATIDQLRVELVTAQHEVGEAWFAGGATLAEAIRRKSAFLERMQPIRGQLAALTIEREDGTLERLTISRKP